MRYALAALFVLGLTIQAIQARNDGQWSATDAAISTWYRDLMMPDVPNVSCCGEADAYWADSFEADRAGLYIAIITDTRDDAPLRRMPRPSGMRFTVPNHKIKYDAGNPTGHGVIFLNFGGDVLCYVPPGGV